MNSHEHYKREIQITEQIWLTQCLMHGSCSIIICRKIFKSTNAEITLKITFFGCICSTRFTFSKPIM